MPKPVKKKQTSLVSKEARQTIQDMLSFEDSIDMPQAMLDMLPKEGDWKESPSSIVSYLDCPAKWFFTRYFKWPEGEEEVYTFLMHFSLIGDIAHRILELFYNEPKEMRTKDNLDATLKTVWSYLKEGEPNAFVEQNMIDRFNFIMSGVEEEARVKRKANKSSRGPEAAKNGSCALIYSRVRDAVHNIYEFDEDPESVEVVENERWVRMTFDGVLFRGKIDRIDLRDSREAIIDYKTGTAPDEKNVNILNKKFVPMGIYAQMTSRDAMLDPAWIELYYLKSGDLFASEITPEALAESEFLLHETIAAMREIREYGDLPFKPASKVGTGSCSYCVLGDIGLCPMFNEESSLEQILEDYTSSEA